MLRRRVVAAVVLTGLALLATDPVASAGPRPKITNGHDANPGEWPFMVGVLQSGVRDNFTAQFCGGALVERDWVLSAAHCVSGVRADEIDVLLGSTNLAANDGVRVRVDAIVIHPDYNEGTQHNDLSLIHLSAAQDLTPLVVATPDDAAFEVAGAQATLLGWGGTTTNQDRQTFATKLQEATMPVIDRTRCSGPGFETFNADVMLCAGSPEQDADGGVDACQGDSGGPLFATDTTRPAVEIGIVSFGPTCGQSPSAYTRVSRFTDWIDATTGHVRPEPLPDGVERIAGADRYATAAALAVARWSSPVHTVFVVTGEGYADALAVAPVASQGGGPVLLVTRDAVPPETSAALDQLQASRVVIAGGTGAVSTAVEQAIRDDVTTVERVAGADRYATAAELSKHFFPDVSPDRSIVFVGSGLRFADALGGAAAAADRRIGPVPLLLTAPDSLAEATRVELARRRPERVYVLGGTAAVSDDVVAAIAALGIEVIRLAGSDRYDTAAQIAETVFADATGVAVATGLHFPDGLVSGALGKPLLLVPSPDEVPTSVTDAIARLGAVDITILGGRVAVSTEQARRMAGAR